MGTRAPTFPIEAEIELSEGTVVLLHLPGNYTLEWEDGEPWVDIDYQVNCIKRGGMDEDLALAEVKKMVNEVMKPVIFSDPDVIAHLNSSAEGSSPSEDMSTPPRSARRGPRTT